MIIHSLENGDMIESRDSALVVSFAAERSVLSTAPLGGGRRDDLKWIFNHGGEKSGVMKAPTYEGHVAVIAKELGLVPEFCSGMSTGADVQNVSIKTLSFRGTSVTAVVTGGIDKNAGRAGDAALWHETEDGFTYVAGTINTMLFIDAALTEGALARSLITCTEAKTAAIQELLVPSCYSSGLATGSGTDGAIIVSNPGSNIRLSDAGKHFKLGELIAKTVSAAVKEALFLQTEICPERQKNVFSRLGRYGINAEAIAKAARSGEDPEAGLSERIERFSQNKENAAVGSLYAHLLDQLSWGMLAQAETKAAAAGLLNMLGAEAPANLAGDERSLINAFINAAASIVLRRA